MTSSLAIAVSRRPYPTPILRQEPRTDVLIVLHYAFPIFLLTFFFVVFATWSIYATPIDKEPLLKSRPTNGASTNANGSSNGNATPNGSTAKATIPKKTRIPMLGRKTRAMFNWALVGVVITYVSYSSDEILVEKGLLE